MKAGEWALFWADKKLVLIFFVGRIFWSCYDAAVDVNAALEAFSQRCEVGGINLLTQCLHFVVVSALDCTLIYFNHWTTGWTSKESGSIS